MLFPHNSAFFVDVIRKIPVLFVGYCLKIEINYVNMYNYTYMHLYSFLEQNCVFSLVK